MEKRELREINLFLGKLELWIKVDKIAQLIGNRFVTKALRRPLRLMQAEAEGDFNELWQVGDASRPRARESDLGVRLHCK